ncbi:MAG: TlpA disulfide reductase family protein [Longimonas sp.]|uniref:peroxiredoxin family protein n=1 Tax=Longimonas sp. TaxID=2039626 RepID=UPI003976D943
MPTPHPFSLPAASYGLAASLLCAILLITACGSSSAQESAAVESVLRGSITVSEDVDPSGDYSGFSVLVIQSTGREVDTLGIAQTDSTGAFSMTVRANERSIYPYVVQRRGNTVHQGEVVVADGDTASLEMELPLRGLARIRSPENDALMAYRNTMALHRQSMVQGLQEEIDESRMGQNIRQTSSILWRLSDSFPGSYMADLAAVESIAMIEGWNDSLTVARSLELKPTNPRYGEAMRIARRAQAEREGQASALDLLEQAIAHAEEAGVSTDTRATLMAEVVRTHLDSLERDAALDAARTLRNTYPDSDWAEWATRAEYEAENLLPGNTAPPFDLTTIEGDTLSLDALRGRPVLLEFYRPEGRLYREQIPTRNAIYEGTEAQDLQIISISLQPDSLLNEAFREGRTLPGHHVIAPEGAESPLLETYNIASLPTRVLIDAEGHIVDKYLGTAIVALQEDLRALVPSDADDASQDNASQDDAP